MPAKTIPITVEDSEPITIKGALPNLGNLATYATKHVDVGLLKDNIGRILEDVADLLPKDLPPSASFEVREVTFSLKLDASGEVSLLSAVGGTLAAGATLQVKLTKSAPHSERPA